MFILSPHSATSIAHDTAGQGFVIFIQFGAAGPVKIEGTRALGQRLRALDADSPVDVYLVGILPSVAPDDDAQSIQQEFAHARLRGEWFNPVKELADMITAQARPMMEQLLEQVQPQGDGDELLTVEEVAEQLGISVPTVRRFVRAGTLPHVRVGRQIRFDPAAVSAALRLR